MVPFELPKLPEVKFNKNGYELRTDILIIAKDLVVEEFHAKFAGWELTAGKDKDTGVLYSEVKIPEYPGLDKVLETAEKLYKFVNQGPTRSK